MSSSDDLKSLLSDMGPNVEISENLVIRILEKLGVDVTPDRERAVRQLIEFAIRMYLVRSSSFHTVRAEQLLDNLLGSSFRTHPRG